MGSHDPIPGFLTIPEPPPSRNTLGTESDVENAAANEGNLGDRRESNMMRMFKRLLRGGVTRPRVVGSWIL